MEKIKTKIANIFDRKTKVSYLMPENLMVHKLTYILALICEADWFQYLFSVLRNMSYKAEKIDIFSSHFWPKELAKKKV